MDSEIQKYSETIAILRREIKAKDKDIHLAATFGNELLEEKDKLKLNLQKLQAENELLHQEKYSLQLDLETQVQTTKTLTNELEIQTEEVENFRKKYDASIKSSNVQKQKISNLLKEKNDLENSLEDSKLEISSLKSKLKQLEKQIETLEEAASHSLNVSNAEEDQPDINLYITKIKELEDALGQATHELESTKLKENRLGNLVKDLEEAVADRDKELSSYSVEIQKAQEFSAELQCEIENLKLDQVDVKRRGNSMFGELDDRRQYVEKEYKVLKQKYDNILKNYEADKEELTRCKGQMAILMSMTSKQYQDVYIEKLEGMLSCAIRNSETLTTKLEQKTKRIQLLDSQKVPPPGEDLGYLNIMIRQAQKKIESVESENMRLLMQKNEKDDFLLQAHRDLFCAKRDHNELQVENMKLKQQIKELTSKPDSLPPEKPKMKIEILPGFEKNPDCLKIVEKLKKEVTETKENDIIPGELMMCKDGFVEVQAPRLSTRAILRKDFSKKSNNENNKSPLKDINDILSDTSSVTIIKHEAKPARLEAKKENLRQVNCPQQ